MNIALVYFSGTGNTKKVCDEYAAVFSALGHSVQTFDLPLSGEWASDFDLLGLGYPIHAFNAPKILLDFAKTLPKRDKKGKLPTFIFKTSGEPVRMSDASSLKLISVLSRRGYDVTCEFQYVMPYNIIFRHSDAAAYKMWTTAKALIPIDAKSVINGERILPEKPFMGGFAAWALRVEHWGAHIIGRMFKTTNACVNCDLCVKNCPAGNIRIDKKGKVKFGGNCMICMRCVFDCPKDAISPGLLKGWKVNGKYSFAPPAEPEQPSKHDGYCKKAYDRYYDNAQKRIDGQKTK